MNILKVGDRITVSPVPGCELDITIEELEDRAENQGILIKRATVHAINLTPPMKSLGKLPDGWTVE